MDIRIDLITDGPETVIHIAGRLAGTAIAELKKTCDPMQDSVVIDLSSLFFADDEGINAIRAMADKGAQVHGASPFVQLLLDDAPGSKKKSDEKSKPLNSFDMGDTVKRCANYR
ncbi:MAG: hypothetical protein QNL14_12645 [Deltaproteobacteria bacterium]|nr:hypothetical protein [Deltaproteobacteria bacterium]